MTWAPLENSTYDTLIAAAAATAGTDPALIKAHMAVESSFNPAAWNQTDPNGTSVGLMQISYGTACALGYTGAPPTAADQAGLMGLFDPATNIQYGAALIAQNLAIAASVVDAISAYNAGFSLVFPGFGPRTSLVPSVYVNQAYVDNVQAEYALVATDFPGSTPAAAGKQGFILLALQYSLVVGGVLALVFLRC